MARVEDIAKMKLPYWTDEQVIHQETSGKTDTAIWGHDIRFVKEFREQTGKRTVVQGHLLCDHVDVDRGRVFRLPDNSPPYRKFRKNEIPGMALQASRWAEIQHSPPLSPEFIDQQLRDSLSQRRMFVVAKEEQNSREIRKVMGSRFERVKVLSMEDRWLAIGEGLIGVNGNG